MPSYKKPNRDDGKLIQWRIAPIFPIDFLPCCFCGGNEFTPLQGRFGRTVPDLVPRNACRAQKATMVQDQPHGAHMLLSELMLARGSSIGAMQSGTPSVCDHAISDPFLPEYK